MQCIVGEIDPPVESQIFNSLLDNKIYRQLPDQSSLIQCQLRAFTRTEGRYCCYQPAIQALERSLATGRLIRDHGVIY